MTRQDCVWMFVLAGVNEHSYQRVGEGEERALWSVTGILCTCDMQADHG